MAGTGIFHRVSGNQAFVYGSLHAVAYPRACYEEGGELRERRAGGRGRDDRGSRRGKGEQAERGRGSWNKRRRRSESDRETERLFNGVELVIGALRVLGRGRERDERGEGRSTRGGHTSS